MDIKGKRLRLLFSDVLGVEHGKYLFGDVVEVEVEGLGTLRNRIVEGQVPIREDVGAQPSASEEVVSTAFGGDWEFRGIRPPKKG